MSGSEEDEPAPPDETEIVEEGDRPVDDAPVKGDPTETVPLSIPRDGAGIHLSEKRSNAQESKDE